jgi:hypothetical protein
MKRYIITFIMLLLLAGCSIFHKNQGIIGKASIAENKAKARIEMVENNVSTINVERLDKIGAFAAGVEHALQNTNQTPAISTAKTLNERIIALSNKPDFNEVREIMSIVDQLITNQIAGKIALDKKDREIEALGISVKDLQVQKQTALDAYYKLADKTAAQDDQYKATLGQMDSFFGLGAIFYGAKRLIIHLAWFIGIGSVLFLVLRLASMSNPIAAGIFQVFNVAGSWIVHCVATIFPKALSLAGNVSSSVFNSYKGVMTKFVDSVQMAKTTAGAAGKEPTLKDVLDELEKSMNVDEKAIVEDIKKSLNWK